ncbi:MAG TPA: GDP-mannose 4,6-dehydratase, partial [Candidatus Limnocylindria bacterium]|nr:GDP-mannose 4,6-dehydratase [Candidatus Limnocylindria bacterium]
MKLLVTGGAGFIGSNFIRYWLREYRNDALVNVDALTYAGDPATVQDVARAEPARYAFAKGDITDGSFVSNVIEEHRPD